jgi:hypothetical protein
MEFPPYIFHFVRKSVVAVSSFYLGGVIEKFAPIVYRYKDPKPQLNSQWFYSSLNG